MDMSRQFQWLSSFKDEISGAYLNSRGILEKGTVFLLEFSESYQFCFAIKPEYPGAQRSQMLRLFYFQKFII